MKKAFKWLCLIFLICPFVLTGLFYLVLTGYYYNRFPAGIWINGQYCTGMTIPEVDALLREKTPLEKEVTVTGMDGSIVKIPMKDMEYSYSYLDSLTALKKKMNPFTWFRLTVTGESMKAEPELLFDQEEFIDLWQNTTLYKNAKETKLSVSIELTGQGYDLKENLSDAPVPEKMTEDILQKLQEGQTRIRLSEDCYGGYEPTEAMKKTLALWEKVQDLIDCRIIYAMGEDRVPVDGTVVSSWILADENGNIQTDPDGKVLLKEDCYKDFIDTLAEEYDTYNVPRTFQSTRGDLVEIQKGTYGNQLDRKTETAYLEEAFLGKKAEVHTPAYLHTALYQGKDDIGPTYIEVDMTEQKMYYYKDGILELETPVVTGNVSAGHSTPSRVCSVYLKQTKRILRGPGYASPVDFWMPVYGSVGIHDATWRNEFGGTIYKTNGSHGCVNTPYDAMKKLFEETEVGTPVIMFY